jgi:hypothetical protein
MSGSAEKTAPDPCGIAEAQTSDRPMCTSHRSFTIAIFVALAMCSHTLGAQRRTDSARPNGELDRVTFAPELHVDLAHS